MEYHEIGEIFEHDGVLLEVVCSPTTNWIDMCLRCYFCYTCTHEDIRCTRSTRKDNRDIVFNRIESSDIREIREKAIFGSIDTFFTDRELKILKMIEKQKETKDIEQKETKKIDGMSDGDWSDCEEPTPPAFMVKNEDGSYSVKEQSNEEIYRSLLDKLFATYKSKDKDYGSAFSEMFDELGIDYAYGKLREKMNRINVLRKQPNMVENEGLEDALLDTAGYAILTLVELKNRKK